MFICSIDWPCYAPCVGTMADVLQLSSGWNMFIRNVHRVGQVKMNRSVIRSSEPGPHCLPCLSITQHCFHGSIWRAEPGVLAASLVYSGESHEPLRTSDILLGNLCVTGVKGYKSHAVDCLKAVFAFAIIYGTIRQFRWYLRHKYRCLGGVPINCNYITTSDPPNYPLRRRGTLSKQDVFWRRHSRRGKHKVFL